MRRVIRRNTVRVSDLKSVRTIMGFAMLSVAAATATANDSIQSKLDACRTIADDSGRLACYDALSVETSVANSAATSTDTAQTADEAVVVRRAAETSAAESSATESAAGTIPLDDSVGKEQVKKTESDDRPTYFARLVRCEEVGPSRLTQFYLDNGQVWQQRNSGRLRMRQCEADVEITSDWFGFKLFIPSQKRTVRVGRVR